MLNWPQYKYNENSTQKYAMFNVNNNFQGKPNSIR